LAVCALSPKEPLIASEFGAGAKAVHGSDDERWMEELSVERISPSIADVEKRQLNLEA
jgi:hypothetical protein